MMVLQNIPVEHVLTHELKKQLAQMGLSAVGVALVVEPSEQVATYTVRYGDTLGEIAEAFGTTSTKLAEINNIKNPDIIHVGQVLKIY